MSVDLRALVAHKNWKWLHGMVDTEGRIYLGPYGPGPTKLLDVYDEPADQRVSINPTTGNYTYFDTYHTGVGPSYDTMTGKGPAMLPDLEHPGTLGGLLALVQEAVGDPDASVGKCGGSPVTWLCTATLAQKTQLYGMGNTKAEALVNALTEPY